MARRKLSRNDELLLGAAEKVLHQHFADSGIERLLCRPPDATRFVGLVKKQLGSACSDSTEQILWTLLNMRKQGRLRKADIAHAG